MASEYRLDESAVYFAKLGTALDRLARELLIRSLDKSARRYS
jgi:hypothetical protein